jgi:hypothetical protein
MFAESSVGVKNGILIGFYFIANYNTKKSVSASISFPKGVAFHGASAEWIMERTEVGGTFTRPLPYYVGAYTDDAYAGRAGSNKGVSYTSQANQNIEMVQGNPVLSSATEQDGRFHVVRMG